MAKLTAEQFADKHANNLKGSLEYMRDGVNRVTESPTAKAAAKADKMLAGVQKSIQDGKWQNGLKRVSLEEWKTKMLNKGVNRVATGIDEARGKVVAFATDLLAHEDRGLDSIKKMPDITLEDSINRMTAWTRHMAKFKRTS